MAVTLTRSAYLDDHAEMIGRPLLTVTRYAQDHNGWAVPVVTHDALSRYAMACRLADQSGAWGSVTWGVTGLTWSLGDGEPMTWSPVGADEKGEPVYAVDGLCWRIV